MKIGITCYPTYGGSGVVATELGIELAARGHQVHFITYSQPFRLGGRERDILYHEVPVSNYPLFEFAPYDLALATRMAEVASYYDSTCCTCITPSRTPSARCSPARCAPPKGGICPSSPRCTAPTSRLVGLDRSYLPITRFGIEQSDGVTAISRVSARQDARPISAIKRPIEAIRNFVNCDVYAPDGAVARAEARKPGRPPAKRCSSISPTSGRSSASRIAFRFSPRVAKQVPAHLMLVGDGPDRSQAEKLAFSLGIGDRVHFLGKQDNVTELLPLADLDADALRDGILRTGRAGGDGLPRPGHRDPSGRSARAHRGRRKRPAFPCRRCGKHVANARLAC